jgi:uncharacterized membrane protein YedE/YeeE
LSVAAALTADAGAQCGSSASSCVTCHEARGQRPVLQDARPWHADHGYGDLCASCHGGEPAEATVEGAHRGLRSPLGDPAASCAGCHADAPARAARYAAAPAAPPPPRPPPRPPVAPRSRSQTDRAVAVVAALLALALAIALRRDRPGAPRPAAAWLRDKTWSPYLAGALLGLVVAAAEVFAGRPLSASGAFDKLAAYAGRLLFPTSQYYGHVMTPGITWQVWMVAGALLGAFASARLSGEARARWLPDAQWTARFGPGRAPRLAVAFVGAALVQVGAGIAGGCTSGLAISGGAALAPGAFVFMAGMFAGGIPAARLWYRGRGA